MKDLYKMAMIFGLIAMLGIGLLLCFTSSENNKVAGTDIQSGAVKE